MAYPVWPASLPQNPYAYGSPKYEPQGEHLRTEMAAGPPKQRPLTTADFENFNIKLCLSKAQLATLKNFYKNDVKKVLPFRWIQFDTGDTALYRFRGPLPREYHAGDGDFWMVDVPLELMP